MVCVYKIQNVHTGMVYIGGTSDFARRKNEHLGDLKRHQHHSRKMQKDFDSFGIDSFLICPIEECSLSSLRDREQFYIDLYDAVKSGYNTSESAYYSCCGFCHMEKSGENNPFYGKHHTEETRKKLRETWEATREQRSGWKHSETAKTKMSNKAKRASNPNATRICQYDKAGNLLKVWDCIADAVEHYGMKSHSAIGNCCKSNMDGGSHASNGFVWRYLENPIRKRVV